MSFLDGVSFGAPHWLWWLAALPALTAIYFFNEKRARRKLDALVASRLKAQLVNSVSFAKRRLRLALLLLGLAAVIASLAQPRRGFEWQQHERKGRDILIAIDTSRSMLANDVQPSRLFRAKLAAEDLVGQLQSDRVGLIAFAGESFLEAPLTVDYNAVTESIESLTTKSIPLGGTDIAGAIDLAAVAFGKGESTDRALVIISDGEQLDGDAIAAAKKYAAQFRIYTVGVGTPSGSLIPLGADDPSGDTLVKDANGNPVKTELEPETLKAISNATHGFYLHLQNGPQEMKALYENGIAKMSEREFKEDRSREPIDRYQWPLAAGSFLILLSLLIGERRRGNRMARASAAILILCASLTTNSAHAQNAWELYQNKQYQKSYDAYEKAMKLAPNSDALHFGAGAAAYRSGDYDKAIGEFSKALLARDPDLKRKAEYNLGNALVRKAQKQLENAPSQNSGSGTKDALSDLNSALSHYESAKTKPPLTANAFQNDVQHNYDATKALIEKLKQQQQQNQQQQNQQQQNQQQQNQQQQNQQQQNQQQQNQQQQNQQQQNQQQQNQQQQNQQQQNQQQQNQQQQNQQQQNQQQQNQQQQNQQQQNQQQQNQQQQNQQQQNQQQQNQQQQNQQQQNQQQQNQQQQNQQQQNQQQQNQQQQNQQQQNQQQQNQQQQNQQQQNPSDEKMKNGKIEENPSANREKNREQSGAKPERAEPGKMNREQAEALLDSQKGKDGFYPQGEQKPQANVLRDW